MTKATTTSKISVNAALDAISATIAEMDVDYSADPKGFYKDRDGSNRAKAMRDSLSGLVFRLHKFPTA